MKQATIGTTHAANLLGISTALLYYRARHRLGPRVWRRTPTIRYRVIDVIDFAATMPAKNPGRPGRPRRNLLQEVSS